MFSDLEPGPEEAEGSGGCGELKSRSSKPAAEGEGMERGLGCPASGEWSVFVGPSWLKSGALWGPVGDQDGSLAGLCEPSAQEPQRN